MALAPLPVFDTRAFFRPATRLLIDTVLRSIGPDEWARPTAGGSWTVRDVVAHLADTALRRLSLQRDAHVLPAPQRGSPASRPSHTPDSANDARAVLDLVNELNRQWQAVSGRFSNRVLLDLYEMAGLQLAAFMEALSLDAPPLFPVSWAGDDETPGWLDIAREFTEVWHHHAQIREALGHAASPDPEWLRAVIGVGVRALPVAFLDQRAPDGTVVAVCVTGEAGGDWSLGRENQHWRLAAGVADATGTSETTRVVMNDDTAWRLLFHSLTPETAASRLTVHGDPSLALPVLRARALVV